LLMMCGIPSSGKTTKAIQLLKFFESRGHSVVLINEESQKVERNEGYKDSRMEKITRAAFLEAVEKRISPETIVIIDSLNYIKGYRYELYCRARSQRTPICVVHCDTPRNITKEWNRTKESSVQWSDELLEELSSRFEVPNPRNRWDRPLFTLLPEDELPFEQINESFNEKAEIPTKNLATVHAKIEDTNFLYEMDQITQAIINSILEAQNTTSITVDQISVPHTSKKVVLNHITTLAELRRLKRQFIKMNSQNQFSTKELISDNFVIFINNLT